MWTQCGKNLNFGQYLTKIHAVRCYATKAEKKKGIDRKPIPKIEYTAESIAAKGFLRPIPAYEPPSDHKQKLSKLYNEHLKSQEKETVLGEKKFPLLAACFKVFQHAVPNSLLHTIKTVNDVDNFYGTPIDTKTPLERMRHMTLPPNLHIQYEYHRWHPDTDTKFGGVTAFPGSSTLVTGLKYKEKYKGHRQEPTYPYY